MNAIVLCGLMVCMVQGGWGVPQPQPNTLVSSLQSFEQLAKLGSFADTIDRFSQFKERFYIITKDDRVYAYGEQGQYQDLFGVRGTSGKRLTTPTEIIELRDRKIVRFCTGIFHMLALSKDGTVYAWGDNYSGQLGLGFINIDTYSIPVVSQAKNVIDIQCSSSTSFALTTNKEVLAWGSNNNNQCGIGNDNEKQPNPKKLTLPKIVSISTTYAATTVALSESSKLYFWGNRASDSPALLPFPSTPVSVVSTANSYFILTIHGEIYMRFMVNDFKPHPFYTGSTRFKSIYADRDSNQGFLVAQSLNGSIYVWRDVSQGSEAFELSEAQDIPSTFVRYRGSPIFPFMVKLGNVSHPTTYKHMP